jgi:uncharacterized protein (TIRG00374 family)
MRNLNKFLLRAGVSFLLLVLLLSSIELGELAEAVSRIHLMTVFFCLLLTALGILTSAFKWQAFLVMHGINHSLRSLVQLYLIGIFFNNFLPTSVGGDFVKATLVSRRRQELPEVLSTIFAERFSGLIAVSCYALAGLVLLPRLLSNASLGVAFLLVICMLLAVLLLWNKSRLRVTQWLPEKIAEIYGRFVLSLKLYVGDYRVLRRAMWTSFLFQLLIAAQYFLVARDLKLDVGFGPLLAVVSLVTLLTILPISLNGLGLREGGFVYLLGQVGVKSHEAIALSLIVYAIVMAFSLLGWIAFVIWQRDETGTLDENKYK